MSRTAAGTKFGKFQLIAHLATGGMAEIFLARQVGLGGFEKQLVIKRMLPNLARDPRFVEMFLEEARLAALLNHPNVIQVFMVGRVKGQYFIAMEYLPGESLAKILSICWHRRVRLLPEITAGIVMKACEGLQYAHRSVDQNGLPLGIVHRDVSPQNIFVLYDGGVKVVDFGIAKAVLQSSNQTQAGTLKGKFAYMSPEQILGEELDGRSDVFSLGIVLWECLVGRRLFHQEGHLQQLEAIVREDSRAPATLNPDIPTGLSNIAQKALARNRDKRFQSAAEMRSALAEYLKASSLEGDTVAIKQYLHQILGERKKARQKLIEKAQQVARVLKPSELTDLSQFLDMDTDTFLPDSEVLLKHTVMIGTPTARGYWSRTGLVALLAAIIAFLVVFTIFNWSDDQPEPPEKKPAVAPVEKTDGGTIPEKTTVEETTKSAEPGKEPKKATGKEKRPAKSPRKRKVRGKHAKQAKLPPGKLRLITVPWVNVFHKKKLLGQTPLVDVVLPAGQIRLRAVNRKAGIRQFIDVSIKSGQRTTKKVNFKRGTTSVPLP